MQVARFVVPFMLWKMFFLEEENVGWRSYVLTRIDDCKDLKGYWKVDDRVRRVINRRNVTIQKNRRIRFVPLFLCRGTDDTPLVSTMLLDPLLDHKAQLDRLRRGLAKFVAKNVYWSPFTPSPLPYPRTVVHLVSPFVHRFG